MVQRLLALLIIQWLLTGIVVAAPAGDASPARTTTGTPEDRFLRGLDCLKKSDLACAELAAASIPSQSPYTKLLAGNIAAAKGDSDTTFRLLLPLQVNADLSPPAIASLHTSLAQAYEAQGDPLRALDQRMRAQAHLTDPTGLLANQSALWKLLSGLSRDELIEMRGESGNSFTQGWIDLALASQREAAREQAIADWLKLYPDHPAASIAATLPASAIPDAAAATTSNTLSGPIALILPLGVEAFYPASDAIERGFVAAQSAANDKNEVRMYATRADENEIAAIYQNALSEGARYVVGPVTDAEVGYLAGNDISIPTLALNQSEHVEKPANLYTFGLSVHDEASQLASMAQAQGMQNVLVIATASGLSRLMAEAFHNAWSAETGLTARLSDVADDTALAELRNTITAQPTDLIIIAADFEEARRIRPYLDIATPTFGFSHIYSGLPYDPANAVLSGIRFIETPWVLQPAAFTQYQPASKDLPPGEMQRWFALGADAYRILSAIAQNPTESSTINGLSGRIHLSATGEITRKLAVARFGVDGVTVETLP